MTTDAGARVAARSRSHAKANSRATPACKSRTMSSTVSVIAARLFDRCLRTEAGARGGRRSCIRRRASTGLAPGGSLIVGLHSPTMRAQPMIARGSVPIRPVRQFERSHRTVASQHARYIRAQAETRCNFNRAAGKTKPAIRGHLLKPQRQGNWKSRNPKYS
jgi:hypothetical protein